MNNTGYFFCGLLVGVVVSAAFGLDFFPGSDGIAPSSDAPGVASTSAENDASAATMKSEIDNLTREKTALEATKTQLATDLAASRAEVGGLKSDLQAKLAEVAGLESKIKPLINSPQAVAELETVRTELEQEKRHRQRLEGDLSLTHQETYNLLKQFFASKRGAEDAILISRYFATSAPEGFKGDLVDHLLNTNRDVILSLSPASGIIAKTGATQQLPGGLSPASGKVDASRPAPAVLKEENLESSPDGNSTNDGKSKNDRQKGVELPPPPGSDR